MDSEDGRQNDHRNGGGSYDKDLDKLKKCGEEQYVETADEKMTTKRKRKRRLNQGYIDELSDVGEPSTLKQPNLQPFRETSKASPSLRSPTTLPSPIFPTSPSSSDQMSILASETASFLQHSDSEDGVEGENDHGNVEDSEDGAEGQNDHGNGGGTYGGQASQSAQNSNNLVVIGNNNRIMKDGLVIGNVNMQQ